MKTKRQFVYFVCLARRKKKSANEDLSLLINFSSQQFSTIGLIFKPWHPERILNQYIYSCCYGHHSWC